MANPTLIHVQQTKPRTTHYLNQDMIEKEISAKGGTVPVVFGGGGIKRFFINNQIQLTMIFSATLHLK